MLYSPQPFLGKIVRIDPDTGAMELVTDALAVDRDGSLLVVEAGEGRLSRIDPVTGEVTTVADRLELGMQGSAGAPPTWAVSSVAVDRTGTIFVTGDLSNVVYRLRARPFS